MACNVAVNDKGGKVLVLDRVNDVAHNRQDVEARENRLGQVDVL
jgi:hypothetical protein